MNEPKQTLKMLLPKIIEGTPPPESSGGPNDTAGFLVGIAGGPLAAISRDQRVGIEALCRKLAVTKKVLASYDDDWNRATGARPLAAQYWGILIALLLAPFAEEEGNSEHNLGFDLKRLNAAYIAIDLAGDMEGIAYLTELKSCADDRLVELTGE